MAVADVRRTCSLRLALTEGAVSAVVPWQCYVALLEHAVQLGVRFGRRAGLCGVTVSEPWRSSIRLLIRVSTIMIQGFPRGLLLCSRSSVLIGLWSAHNAYAGVLLLKWRTATQDISKPSRTQPWRTSPRAASSQCQSAPLPRTRGPHPAPQSPLRQRQWPPPPPRQPHKQRRRRRVSLAPAGAGPRRGGA